jgi:hypothetical protein
MGRQWVVFLGLAALVGAMGCRGGVDINEQKDRAHFTAEAEQRIADMDSQIRAVREASHRFDEHVQVAVRLAGDAAEEQLQQARRSLKGLNEAPRGGSMPFKDAVNARLNNANALLEQAQKDVHLAADAVQNAVPPS